MNKEWTWISRKHEHDLFLVHDGVGHFLLSDVVLVAGLDGVNFAGLSNLFIFILFQFFCFVDLFGNERTVSNRCVFDDRTG